MLWGIIIGLALLMYLCYRGVSILVAAPLMALFVALTGRISLFDAYTVTFMQGAGNYFISWFPTFFLGALFGKIMDDSGGAASVARWIIKLIGKQYAIIALVAATAILTYGGISLFVVVFAVYPIGAALFKEVDLPRRLLGGTIALGAFTFTMTAIPGTPQIQNIIPTKYFGTTPTAAPVLGIIAAVIIAVGGTWYMVWQSNIARRNGEHFVPGPRDDEMMKRLEKTEGLPSPYAALAPMVLILILLNIVKLNIVISLAIGIVLSIVLLFPYFRKTFLKTINDGSNGSLLAIMNTSIAVGFGSVVKAVPGFKQLVDVMSKLSLGNGALMDCISVNVLAGVTGSASGGMSIALEALAPKLLATGVDPAVLHRIASVSSGGLDTLPQNGAVLTLLAVAGLTHKDSYKDIFVVSLVIPVLASLLLVLLSTLGLNA